MNRTEVVQGVRECVATVLGIDAGVIREDQRIVDELGGDSLDLLDLLFQLERRFQIKISPRDIERRAQARLGGAPLEVDGVYTAAALAELRAALPEVPADELREGTRTADLPRRFRVATFVNLVLRFLQEQRPDAIAGAGPGGAA
ncbi:MAG: acyl carrier protein [Planctomycetes bacterium]|nr:acyl carrier protein [Planctomycetota bacterium]